MMLCTLITKHISIRSSTTVYWVGGHQFHTFTMFQVHHCCECPVLEYGHERMSWRWRVKVIYWGTCAINKLKQEGGKRNYQSTNRRYMVAARWSRQLRNLDLLIRLWCFSCTPVAPSGKSYCKNTGRVWNNRHQAWTHGAATLNAYDHARTL